MINKSEKQWPRMLILNQMAGPLTWELVETLAVELGSVALLTGYPDTLKKVNKHVILCAAVPYQRGSLLRRSFSWVRYCLKAFFWLWQWPAKTPLLLYSNPPLLCWLGWLVYQLRGTPYSVMVHDIYPDVLVRLAGFSEGNVIIRAWRSLNRHSYKNAKLVMTLGENMAETIICQFDPQQTAYGKVRVAYPWVDTDNIRPMAKTENWFAQEQGQIGKLTVMYSGNMGIGHDIETMLAAAKMLECDERITFLFIGGGPKRDLVHGVAKEGQNNIRLLDWQPEDVLPYSLATADVALVSLDEGMEGLAVPSKTIYAMAAGSILVALARGDSELKTWVEEYKLGTVIAPGNAENLAVFLVSLLETSDGEFYRANSRRTAEARFSRPVVVPEILEALMAVHEVEQVNGGE